MYIRFVIGGRDPQSRAENGFFHGAYDLLEALPHHDWLHKELRRELDWFRHNLACPDRFKRPFRCCRNERSGICWFRPEAGIHISRAHYMAWVMEEMGMPVRKLRIKSPGISVWEDEHQVVAIAPRRGPAAFQ